MANEEYDLRQLVARLSMPQFRTYLVTQGWEEKISRYADHVYFEVQPADGSDPYQLYLPVSKHVPKYHTRVMRAIYKLCGIEEREPLEVARAVFAIAEKTIFPAANAGTTCLRVRNTGSTRLQLRIDEPAREHLLLPGEAIELNCQVAATSSMEIDCGSTSLAIFTSGRE